jgi:hypothetical protein
MRYRAGVLALAAFLESDGPYVLVGLGMSKSLQIFLARRSSISECRGTDDLLFFAGLPHHE